MKKLLAIIATVALTATMFCSTALADSAVPTSWDLDVKVRKADSANVKKDGIIGENEYDKLEIDNNQLLITGNSRNRDDYYWKDAVKQAESILDTIEYYFSWDETNGLNIAVKYKPVADISTNTTTKPGNAVGAGEGIMLSPFGGLLITGTDNVDGKGQASKQFYMAVTKNDKGEVVWGTYNNQDGFNGGYALEEGKNIAINYDKTSGEVIYEWSIPLNQISLDSKKAYFTLGIYSSGIVGSYDANVWGVNLGRWGFFVGQDGAYGDTAFNHTTYSIDEEAVGTKPEPPATPTPTPVPTPTATPDVQKSDENNNGWMLYVMIIEAVAIIALAAVLVMKKKK